MIWFGCSSSNWDFGGNLPGDGGEPSINAAVGKCNEPGMKA